MHFSLTNFVVVLKGTILGRGVGACKLEDEAGLIAEGRVMVGVEDEVVAEVAMESMLRVEAEATLEA